MLYHHIYTVCHNFFPMSLTQQSFSSVVQKLFIEPDKFFSTVNQEINIMKQI